MAERLTEKDYFAWHYRCGYQNKKDSLERTQKEHKLGKLEDILEKYGIESVEELSKIFSYLSGRFINSVYSLKHKFDSYEDKIKYLANKKGQYYEELYETKQDRDTWKRACELACEKEDDCYVYDNIHRAYEFYQQAKTEGNDDK